VCPSSPRQVVSKTETGLTGLALGLLIGGIVVALIAVIIGAKAGYEIVKRRTPRYNNVNVNPSYQPPQSQDIDQGFNPTYQPNDDPLDLKDDF